MHQVLDECGCGINGKMTTGGNHHRRYTSEDQRGGRRGGGALLRRARELPQHHQRNAKAAEIDGADDWRNRDSLFARPVQKHRKFVAEPFEKRRQRLIGHVNGGLVAARRSPRAPAAW